MSGILMQLTDQQLFKIAFLTAIIGMVGMIIFAGEISPRSIKIIEINPGMLDEEVCIEGLVEKVEKAFKSDTYFLTINDGTGKIRIVVFESTVNEIEKNGFNVQYFDKKRIKVTGRVNEYRGNMGLVLKDAKSLKILT